MHYIIFPLFLIFFVSCLGQKEKKFVYQKISDEHLPKISERMTYRQEVDKLKQQAFDLTKALPAKYVIDASRDYTFYIQKALNEHPVVLFPNFPLLISDDGLQVGSNSTWIFQSESKLIKSPTSKDTYGIIGINNKKNVKFFFPIIVGDRKIHKSNAGEWGMGIFIRGSENINIFNPIISNCWGDGIYIGKGIKHSEDIKIFRQLLDNNRRNGISIVSAKNVLIQSPVISNTNGTLPASGIDIEPNNNNDIIYNITINSPLTFNSDKFGILIYLDLLRGLNEKKVDITINNPIDIKSIEGIKISEPTLGYKSKSKVVGSINVNNPKSDKKINIPLFDSFSPTINIK